MSWQFNNSEAVFIQIANRLRADILNGVYASGEQIPPVRQLAAEAAVNPNTMQKALMLLEDEGLLHAQGTVGRFVTTDDAVLNKARENIKLETVRRLLTDAYSVGISPSELIRYIQKEELDK